MKKIVVTMICIIVIIGAVFTAREIVKKESNNEQNEKIEARVSDEKILDECTDEYEKLENEKMVQANSEEEKVSLYCSFIIKTYYKGCGHTKSEYLELPKELVNCKKEDIQERYKEYEIEKFASNEIVLYQEKEGECGEHYIVRDTDGKVMIYKKKSNNEEELVEETDIATDYLTETDKINMKKGIEVNGRQELNQLIEDFE